MSLRNKRVLVTGGAGFIGSHIIRKLIKYNCDIIVADNFSTGVKENLKNLEVNILNIAVDSKDFIKRIIEYTKGDIDFIFHFGSPSSVILFNEAPEEKFRETVSGFINIMELSREINVQKVIYASSGSVYGKSPPPNSEFDIPRPVNLYGIAKLTCEIIANYYRDEVKSVGLRIFAGYGPGEDHKGRIASPVTLFLKSILSDKRPIVYGDGTQSRDFVYIDDIVEAIIRSAVRETPPIINVGSGRSYTFNEVIKIINDMLGKNIKPLYVPKPPKYLEKTQADITLMKQILEIEPIDLREGLARYLKVLNLN
ncbi:hypothetical protein DRJ17_05150 [Candidatus Woesearchaeota archaeon]|nr:MAG: hypothetical protein DRJ17_05150 [Candidatus Woesearchaeota archaeon]